MSNVSCIAEILSIDVEYVFISCFNLHNISDGGKELLSMCVVIDYLCRQYKPLIPIELIESQSSFTDHDLQNTVGSLKGQLVVNAAKVCILLIIYSLTTVSNAFPRNHYYNIYSVHRRFEWIKSIVLDQLIISINKRRRMLMISIP